MFRNNTVPILLLSLCIIFLSTTAIARNEVVLDSLIKFNGYILDSVSQSPKRLPIGAKIILERLPYGSEIGLISSKDSTGYFEYMLSFDHDYRIDVKSKNHQTYSETIKTKQWAANGELKKNYYLKPQLKEDQVIRLDKLIFEQGKAVITQQSHAELDQLVSNMKTHSSMTIQLEGHTDWRGDHKSNMKLSEQRVDAVKNYLIVRGIHTKRIKTKAFGGTHPVTRKSSLEASAINRRVEVRILNL